MFEVLFSIQTINKNWGVTFHMVGCDWSWRELPLGRDKVAEIRVVLFGQLCEKQESIQLSLKGTPKRCLKYIYVYNPNPIYIYIGIFFLIKTLKE